MVSSNSSSKTKTYKKNFLTQVIYKLNFIPDESITEEGLKTYKKSLGDNYSTLSNIVQQGLLIQGDPSGITTEQNESMVWRIESKDDTHIIEVEKNSFAIVVKNYQHFKDMRIIVENAQSLFIKQFKEIKDVQRLGLRYIDQIKVDKKNVNWADYINSKLTAHLDFADRDTLRRSMHTMVIAYDDETQINLNYGIFNNYFPAPIIDEEFILDFDAYTTFSVQIGDTLTILDKFNTVLTDLFEQSITDKLREIMEVKNG